MSLRVVQHILQLYNEIGQVIRDPKAYATQGRSCLLDTKSCEFVLALLESHPDLYLNDIVEHLTDQLNVTVSIATAQRMLKLLGVTSKKNSADQTQLSKVAAEHCAERRLDYLCKISKGSTWRLMFCDESSVNLHTTYHTMGHALKGKRATMKSYFQCGERYSVLPALALDGYIYCDIVVGSFNSESFKAFVKGS